MRAIFVSTFHTVPPASASTLDGVLVKRPQCWRWTFSAHEVHHAHV